MDKLMPSQCQKPWKCSTALSASSMIVIATKLMKANNLKTINTLIPAIPSQNKNISN